MLLIWTHCHFEWVHPKPEQKKPNKESKEKQLKSNKKSNFFNPLINKNKKQNNY